MAYIDVDKARKHLRVDCLAKYPTTYIDGLLAAAEELTRIPTADVAEVKHGEWINGRRNDWKNNTYEEMCSVCGRYTQEFRRGYCPNCGAKMD